MARGGRRRRDRRRPSQMREPRSPTASPSSIRTGSTRARRRPRTAISPRSASPSCSARPCCGRLRGRGFFAGREEPKLIELLDLVALGTVADVAQLRGPQPRLRHPGAQGDGAAPQCRPRRARRRRPPRPARRPARDLGFALGPRINAGGRVGKSDLGVRLLTTEDPDEAEAIAAELDRLNEERRAIEAAVCEAAEALCRGAGQPRGRRGRRAGLASGRDRHRRRPPQGEAAPARHRRRARRGRHRQGLGPLDLRRRSRRRGARGEGQRPARRRRRPRHGGRPHRRAPARIEALADFLDERLAADVARSRDDRALLLDAVLAPGGVCPDLCDALEAGGPYGAGWPAPRVAAGPVAHRQGGRGRQRPSAADRRRRRRPPGQGDRLPHGRQRRSARRCSPRRRTASSGSPAGSSATIIMAAPRPSSTSRTPPGPTELRRRCLTPPASP